MTRLRTFSCYLCVSLVTCAVVLSVAIGAEGPVTADTRFGTMESELVAVAYQGTETFSYVVSYTGGIPLGHLDLTLNGKGEKKTGRIAIKARVTTDGSLFDAIYPIDDTHLTRVEGEGRYPFFYEVHQKEGWGYRAHRLTRYDQQSGRVVYRKNDKREVVYTVEPYVHNEFSAFFASRLMRFAPGESFLVPTFADKRRSEVEVRVLGREKLEKTVLGDVETMKVTPILPFKGLYGKEGDTTIWYTDDVCRVPVRITSKITIGSITADLLFYDNPLCERYSMQGGARGAD